MNKLFKYLNQNCLLNSKRFNTQYEYICMLRKKKWLKFYSNDSIETHVDHMFQMYSDIDST